MSDASPKSPHSRSHHACMRGMNCRGQHKTNISFNCCHIDNIYLLYKPLFVAGEIRNMWKANFKKNNVYRRTIPWNEFSSVSQSRLYSLGTSSSATNWTKTWKAVHSMSFMSGCLGSEHNRHATWSVIKTFFIFLWFQGILFLILFSADLNDNTAHITSVFMVGRLLYLFGWYKKSSPKLWKISMHGILWKRGKISNQG